jgi:hypothetical protein
MNSTNGILIGAAAVFLILYLLRRRSRLSRDDD